MTHQYLFKCRFVLHTCFKAAFLACILASSSGIASDFVPHRQEVRSDYGRKVALVVGVNQYSDDIGKLNFAVNDARDFSRTLAEDFGFEVVNSNFESGHCSSNHFDSLFRGLKLGPEDCFIFFFAGHSLETGQILFSNSHKQRNGDFLNAISAKGFQQRINELNCDHKLIIFDSCYSGAAANQQLAKTNMDEKEQNRPEPKPRSQSFSASLFNSF